MYSQGISNRMGLGQYIAGKAGTSSRIQPIRNAGEKTATKEETYLTRLHCKFITLCGAEAN